MSMCAHILWQFGAGVTMKSSLDPIIPREFEEGCLDKSWAQLSCHRTLDATTESHRRNQTASTV